MKRSRFPGSSSTPAQSSRSRTTSGVKHLDDEEEGTSWDGPLVVLVDTDSAGAAEVFAGVIKDYGRGLLVGDSPHPPVVTRTCTPSP